MLAFDVGVSFEEDDFGIPQIQEKVCCQVSTVARPTSIYHPSSPDLSQKMNQDNFFGKLTARSRLQRQH